MFPTAPSRTRWLRSLTSSPCPTGIPNRIPRCQILSPTDKSPTCTPAPTVTCRTAQGRPENASLTGLPADYLAQQMAAFKSGARKTSEPELLPVKHMVGVAQHADGEQAKAAANYFASLKPKPWIHVVETTQVT